MTSITCMAVSKRQGCASCIASLQQFPIRCPTSSSRNHIMAFRALAQCTRNGTQRSVLCRLVGLADAETPAMTNITRTLQTSRQVSAISLCSRSIHVYGLRLKPYQVSRLHRSTGSSHTPAGNEMQEDSPSGTKWQNNAIMYEYAKESKPVRFPFLACLLLGAD